MFKISYLLRKEMSLLRQNSSVSKLIMNCSSVSCPCLVFFKLPFKTQTLRLLMMWPSALKCNGRGRKIFSLIVCVITKSIYEKYACYSNILCITICLHYNVSLHIYI